MHFGWPSVCLNVGDLDASARFYEALGMEVMHDVSVEGMRVVLRSGGFRLGLFKGIETNCVNFRGADVVAVHDAMKKQFPDLVGEPIPYQPDDDNRADAAGASWMTRDPDGNAVFFDTNANELGESFKRDRIRQILSDAEHELASLGATECVDVLRRELIEKF